MLNSFWNWFVIIGTVASMLACWWLLHWTKGVSNRKGDGIGSTGHVWDEDLVELNAPLPRWWLHLFNITIVYGFIYLALYPGLGNVQGLLGWTQLAQYNEEITAAELQQKDVFANFNNMTPEQLIASDEANDTGRRLFANNCAMCHGSDGRGAPGFPNLADDDWLYGSAHEQILTSINQGRMGVMPPLGDALGDQGVLEVSVYVQQLAGQKADQAMAAAGKTRFAMLCAACHGPDGQGNQALGAPNLSDDIWLYGGNPDSIIASVRRGRNGNMPAHENLLSEDRRRLLAAYVASLSKKESE
ncbi:MAG: cytochrome-c oxidase, cbb3-type subunit III [Xanthomonadales bacterium]|nr:cytochrome-c oxidase, cbb3-type subunit III [Xanthomonadales bacterium]